MERGYAMINSIQNNYLNKRGKISKVVLRCNSFEKEFFDVDICAERFTILFLKCY